MLSITLPWPKPILSPNGRGHRMAKAAATKAYRKACAEAAWAAGIDPVTADGLTLAKIVFHPPSRRWDDDNCEASFKPGRDGLADAMGADDKKFRPTREIGEPVKGGAVVVLLDSIPAQ